MAVIVPTRNMDSVLSHDTGSGVKIGLVLPSDVLDALKRASGGNVDQAIQDALLIYISLAQGSVKLARKEK